MIPKLGQKVYCIYDNDCILVENVGFIGKESFIIENFWEDVYFDSLEWYYENYNDLWFTDLSKAKEKLHEIHFKQYGIKGKIVKHDSWYDIE